MIRIHNGKLIAEITPVHNNPLEKLRSIQDGLHDLVLCAAISPAPANVKENAIQQLHCLLQLFQFNDLQYSEIEEAVSKAPGLCHLITSK